MSLTVHRHWDDPLVDVREFKGGREDVTASHEMLDFIGGGGPTHAGVMLSPETALRQSTVLACVTINSSVIAGLPAYAFRHEGAQTIDVTDDPGVALLNGDFHSELSSVDGRRMLQAHQEMRGFGIAYIERLNSGDAAALYPIPASAVTIDRKNGRRRYKVTLTGGGSETLFEEEVFVVPAMTVDGLVGLSPIEQCRQAVGLALAAEEFGARFFGNGASMHGALETDAKMDKLTRDRLTADFNARHKGLRNAHLVGVFADGLKYRSIGIDPEQAQFLETRAFQVADICRMFGVPSFLVNDSEKSTAWGSGIAQIFLAWKQVSLAPRANVWQAEARRKLVRERDRGRVNYKLDFDEFLRADQLTRYKAHQIGILTGFINRNEARAEEHRNPATGLDEFLTPQNMRLTDEPAAPGTPDQIVNGGGQA